jgi:regulator of replication initiation timing
MIKPLTRIVGKSQVKIRALTKIIPAKKIKENLKNFVNTVIPLIPPALLEFEDERQYLVPKTLFDVLVSDEDVDDWNNLFARFNDLLGNLTKVLNNIRKIDYHKIVTDKLLEQEISNRRIKLTEKLLEKDTEKEKEEKDGLLSGVKIDNLTEILLAAGFAVAAPFTGNRKDVNPLDAATIESAGANGADLKAAAHLATLEASSPQDVADVMQVMLNRAETNHSGYGPLIQQIIAPEQFSPYSAAIYSDSADTDAASYYGSLNVTPQEIVSLASQPDGIEKLVERFGAGNAAIANQVLNDFKNEGPLSKEAAKTIGGMVSFRGMNSDVGPNFTQRHKRGNKFFATGGIILPKLLNQYNLWYNTDDKTSDISNFIVDRPTIIDVQSVGEPIVVIPTERPIGHEVLSILFKEPFRKIEKIFERREQEAKPQTPIENNTTSINRTTIPQSEKPKRKSQKSSTPTQDPLKTFTLNSDNSINMMSLGTKQSEFSLIVTEFNNALSKSSSSHGLESNIHTVSQKTDNVLGLKTILMTQDIFIEE